MIKKNVHEAITHLIEILGDENSTRNDLALAIWDLKFKLSTLTGPDNRLMYLLRVFMQPGAGAFASEYSERSLRYNAAMEREELARLLRCLKIMEAGYEQAKSRGNEDFDKIEILETAINIIDDQAPDISTCFRTYRQGMGKDKIYRSNDIIMFRAKTEIWCKELNKVIELLSLRPENNLSQVGLSLSIELRDNLQMLNSRGILSEANIDSVASLASLVLETFRNIEDSLVLGSGETSPEYPSLSIPIDSVSREMLRSYNLFAPSQT